MKKTSIYFLALVTCFGLFGLTRCTKDKTPVPPEPCDPNKVYYQNDIVPLISTNCATGGCHDAVTQADGLNLSTYEGLMGIVKPGNPSESEIMKVINETKEEDRMPLGLAPLSQEQKDLISKWISLGALNNYCVSDTATCDTDSVSYSKEITEILKNCQSCHSGTSPKGGINLSNHTGVKTVGDNGKLYNAVAQNGQAQAMPPSGPKLPDCDIKKIKSWVEANCPNN